MIVLNDSIGPIIAFLYGLCSVSMAFLNKAILTSYNFNYPFFIISCQMLFTIIFLEVLRFQGNKYLVKFTLSRAQMFLIPSIFYAINSICSLTELNGLNIPMYGVIKRCAPLAIMLLGVIILKKPLPSISICMSVLMIAIGCVIAGYGDLSFDTKAYALGVASVISQAIYLLLVQKHASDFGAVESLHLNSFNTLPLLFFFSYVTGEFSLAINQYDIRDIKFNLTFLSVIIFGCCLNYMLFLCTTYNSALTTSITGTLKTIIQTIIGMFTFSGISFNFFILFGISLNMTGGILYTIIKYQANISNKSSTDINFSESTQSLIIEEKNCLKNKENAADFLVKNDSNFKDVLIVPITNVNGHISVSFRNFVYN